MATTSFAFSDDELLNALTSMDDVDATTDARERHPSNTSIPDGAFGFPGGLSDEFLHSDFGNEAFGDSMPVIIASHGGDGTSMASTSEQNAEGDSDTTYDDAQSSETKITKPSRKRRKHELDAMRALASSLEKQLKQLKQAHHKVEPGTNLFWKRVADQLALDRQRATTENARLREIFQDQSKVLKGVQKALLKSPDLVSLGVDPSPIPRVGTVGSTDVYSKLFSVVASKYPGTDSVIQKAGVNSSCEDSRRVNMEMRSEAGQTVMCLQVAESRQLPFKVSTVNEGVWQFLAKETGCAEGNEIFQRSFQARGDDVFGPCKIGCSFGLYTINADVAVRRFINGKRLTYVWECRGRCNNDPVPSSSFRLHETGWVVFEPLPTDPEKSVFRTCVDFIPLPLVDGQDLGSSAKDIGLVTEVAMSVYERTIGYIYENVVSELMNEMRVAT